jgi:hypothetical protein
VFHFRSTALALCALTLVGFSGHLASARAEPVDLPAAKVYAATTDLSSKLAETPAQALATKTTDLWAITVMPQRGHTACGLGCTTGFLATTE